MISPWRTETSVFRPTVVMNCSDWKCETTVQQMWVECHENIGQMYVRMKHPIPHPHPHPPEKNKSSMCLDTNNAFFHRGGGLFFLGIVIQQLYSSVFVCCIWRNSPNISLYIARQIYMKHSSPSPEQVYSWALWRPTWPWWHGTSSVPASNQWTPWRCVLGAVTGGAG